MSLELFKSLLLLALSIVGFVRAVFDFRFETFTKVKGDAETLIEFDMRLIGRQRLLNGTITNHVDMDDTYEFSAILMSFVNGEWKHTNIGVHFKSCLFMTSVFERYWANSLKDSNIPRGKEACPFKKGLYYMRNVEISTENWVYYVRPGLNKVELRVLKNNISYGGFTATGVLKDRST